MEERRGGGLLLLMRLGDGMGLRTPTVVVRGGRDGHAVRGARRCRRHGGGSCGTSSSATSTGPGMRTLARPGRH